MSSSFAIAIYLFIERCNCFCFLCLQGPPNPENLPEDGKLKSEMMTKDNRRYYLDLKENSRGRFLRVRLFCLYLICAIPEFEKWCANMEGTEIIVGITGIANNSPRRSPFADSNSGPRNDRVS